MIRQVGVGLKTDDDGTAYRGLIVRHLVLPGHIDNSLAVLEKLADLTSPLPPFDLHLSLMAQYYPPVTLAEGCDLRRPITPDEYRTVSERFRALGFDGWLQELAAESHYRPDFTHPDNPFEA
jgi:putative pyruvate formate lyase activating enzyme